MSKSPIKAHAAFYISLLSFLLFTLPLSAQGNFTLAVSPSSVSIPQNGQAMLLATTTISGGFNNSISLSASGQPMGVVITFNPSTIQAPGSGTSVMTITDLNIAQVGTYPITVTGNGGGIKQTATVTLTITAKGKAGFTLSAIPAALTVAQGQQGTSNIFVVLGSGFNGAVSLSASGMPTGTTVNFSPQTIPAPGDGISTMTITVGGSTSPGTYPITVTGNGGGIQQNTTVTLTVTGGQGNFTISASPSQVTVAQGSRGTSTITTTISNGFNSAIGLTASGVPSGTFVTFVPFIIAAPGAGSSTMFLTVGSSTPAGSYPITVTGTGGGIQHNTTVTLTVTAAGSFTISASPSSLTIQQGNQGTSTITTTISGGFNSSVNLSASGMPTGTTVTFNPPTIPPPGNGSSAMTVTVGSNTPPGTYPITVTGTGGGIQQNTTVSLTVTGGQANFAISASPSSLTVEQGNQGTSTITTTISGGFNSSISLSASGTPSGTTVTFNPPTIPAPGNGNSAMTITVGSSTTPGIYPITVTGNGGGIQQNTTVTLTVTASGPGNFTISSSPASLSIVQGYQGISTITTTVSGGFYHSIALSASGQPTGTTVTFNPPSIPGPGYGTSAMTIAVSTSTPVGTYPITVTGTGGGIQQNTTVVLTVTAPQPNPYYTISVSPLSISVVEGNQGSTTVTTNISGGFNNSISLSAADVPAGVTVSFNPQTIGAPGAGTSTMTITVAGGTLTGVYPIMVTGTGGGIQQTALMTLAVTTVGAAGAPFPASPQVFINTTWNPPTGTGGTTYYAHTTADFVNSLNSVMPGDTIVLDAGSVYTASCGVPFALQPHSNPNGQWIYIESSALASLPPPGTRVSPSDAQYMPQITTGDACAAIFAVPGANHYRLVGLEITSTSDVGGDPSQNPPSNNWSFYLLQTTSASPSDTLVDSITLDRVYAHGSDTQDVIHAVNLDGTNMALVDSYVSDIHQQGADSQGVLVFFSPGPYKIVNNYISASTENVMFSPTDGLGTANNPYLPSDIELRRNHLYKPPAWDSCGVHGTVPPGDLLPDGTKCPAGVNNQWVVKDNLEFKIGQRALVTGNVLENNWVSGQVGYSLVLTARVQNAPNLWISDILVQSNTFLNVDRGINTLEQSDQQGYTYFGYNKRVWINNNLMLLSTNLDNVGGHWGITMDGGGYVTGYGFTNGLTDYIFQHNTMLKSDGTPVDFSIYFTLPPDVTCTTVQNSPTHNVWILDNTMTTYPNGDCGWTTPYGGLALSGVQVPGGYFPGYMSDPTGDFPSRYFGNVMFLPTGNPTNWPANNDATGVPFTYVNPGGGDYQLLVPDWTDTTDGNVSGIDWTVLQQAMNP